MGEIFVAIIALAVVLILLVLYLFARENALAKRLESLESAIESNYKEIAKCAKTEKPIGGFDSALLQNEIDELAQKNSELSKKVADLQAQIDSFFAVPAPTSLDASQVVALYNQGYSPEEIAKSLRANVDEINLALKLNNLSI